MKIDRVKYTRQRLLGIENRDWVGFEAELSEGDDPLKALAELIRLTEAGGIPSSNGKQQPQEYEEPILKNASPEDRIKGIIKQMNTCKDKKNLEVIYAPLAKKFPELLSAYNEKLKTFE